MEDQDAFERDFCQLKPYYMDTWLVPFFYHFAVVFPVYALCRLSFNTCIVPCCPSSSIGFSVGKVKTNKYKLLVFFGHNKLPNELNQNRFLC